ncbi:MAG: hypothetical protein ABIQ16_25645 [Polyangiaceae bacterium]
MTARALQAARGLALSCAFLVPSACHSPRVGPPPDAPSDARPLSAIPADLDLVVRLDLSRIRDTLGAPAMAALSAQALHGLHGADSATDELLLSALKGTDTLWFGVRPTRGLEAADSVFVMSGHFPGFDPHRAESTPRFAAPVDLGGDFRRFDRPHPPSRSAPARIYVHGDDLVVSLSEAEIDSVARSLEEQRGAPALEPAEKGVLSAVARPRVLPAELFAGSDALRRVVQRAERLDLSADLTAAGVDATLALRFEDATVAEHVAKALSEVREALQSGPGRLGKFAARLKVSNAAEYVTLQLALERDELAGLVNCSGSNCGW